ncbi:hypothetical protein GE300_09180 [Rhodobacteraceae bacterium 2CG4]|uniref:SPOR domain-containing protein n=1 Tax=Halovulum marinum TaxID=2662447 RepID=A0A6L5YZX9_9RHOB|nr:SPOR domain-containing protein [Halovulum marinum]MSU89788.1 hypothetical protein [Halovulum marinum]
MQDAYYDEFAEEGEPQGLRRVLFLYFKWGGAVLSLMVLGLLVLWAYRLGVRDANEIPVIQAMERPARILPEDPGGEEVAHQGLEVNEILAGNEAQRPGGASLAPAVLSLDRGDDPAPAADADAQAADAGTGEADGDPVAETILSLLTAENSEAAPGQEAEADGISAADGRGRPRPRVRPETLGLDTARARITAPREQTRSAALAAAPVDPENLAAGTRLVQLGAFDTPEQAQAQWNRLLGGHSDLLGSKQYYVQRAESNGRVYFRLRALGFEGGASQRALCEALVARALECIPVTVR